MPEGVRRPTMPSGLTSAIARSTNSEYMFMSPPGKQRIVAGASGHAECRLGARLGLCIVPREWIAVRLQVGDHPLAVGGLLRHRDVSPAGGEPFDLLQLDPVPRGIADDRVEPARQLRGFPDRPHPREGDLPT